MSTELASFSHEQMEDLELMKYLQDCPQIGDPLETNLLDQFYITDDIWNGIQLPDLSNEVFNLSSQQLFDDLPCLATPPLSPPDSENSPTPPTNDVSNNQLPTSSIPSASCHYNDTIPSSVTSNGQMVQVLKSGESVPVNNLLSSISDVPVFTVKSEPVKANTCVAGIKRQHPDSNNTQVVEPKVSKRQQRLIKNRESASLSRQKKKEYVQNLESKLKEAATKNIALLKENDLLRNKVTELQKENELLRTAADTRSTVPRPAVILMIALCFTVAIFPLKGFVFPYSSKPVTSLTVNHPTGRALMSLQTHLDTPQQQRAAVRQQRMWSDRRSVARSEGKTICTCPPSSNTGKHNYTKAIMLNNELLSVSYDQNDINQMISPTYNDLEKKSLIILTDKSDNSLTGSNGCHCHPSRGIATLYKSLKKSMTRDLNHFYLISFKDHLLLNAPNHNTTHNPSLSVIIPAHNDTHSSPPGYMSMLQLNCKVVDSNVFLMEIP